MPASVGKKDWKLFAWQGLQCEVPSDWELGSVTGDARKGSLRLEDEELSRLEARWETGRPRTDLEPVLDRHIADLEKAARKRRLSFNVERDVPVAAPDGMQVATFEWKSDYKALNLLTFCPECHRIALLRAIARKGERIRPIAARVFESFRDHAQGETVPWAVYGMRLDAPKRFELERNTLNLQRIELGFRDGGDQATAARFNLAGHKLRDMTLRQWAASTYRKEWSGLALRAEEESYRGRPGLKLSGRHKRLSVPGLFSKARFAARVWHCQEEDKLYVATWRARMERMNEFEPFCDSMDRHEEDG